MLAHEPRRLLEDVRAEVDALRVWADKPLDDEEVELAWAVRERLRLPLIAATQFAGCSYFLTEDMGGGAVFGSVTIIDPFHTGPSELLPKH